MTKVYNVTTWGISSQIKSKLEKEIDSPKIGSENIITDSATIKLKI
jgi:hypothetical protein